MSQRIQIPAPLYLTATDLKNMMNMCEASIKAAEFAHHLFGLDEVVQARAIASGLQAKFEVEIGRQEMLHEQRRLDEIEKLEQKKRDDLEAAKREEAVKAVPELAKI
jgi:hypothetical protein